MLLFMKCRKNIIVANCYFADNLHIKLEYSPVRKKVQFFDTTKCFGKKKLFLLSVLCK